MTPRQARTERRTAERKAKKAEIRRNKQAGIELHDLPVEQEFSAELMAEANAIRDRVHRQAAALKLAVPPNALECPLAQIVDQNPNCKGGATKPRFVPQSPTPAPAPPPSGFVPQTTPRAERNRQNAQHSTGPRTSIGKLASSRNATKHGLASGQVIIPGEDHTAFEALLQDLLAEHQSASPTEDLLIQEMAQSYWLAQRAVRLQNECFSGDGDVDDKRLSLYMRYQTTHDRAFHKALSTLMKMRKDKARGFVSQTPTAPANRPPDPAAAPPESGFVSQHDPQIPEPDQFVRQNEITQAA